MRFRALFPLGLALSALALAAPQRHEVRSYVNVGGKVEPAFAWCDAPNAVLALGTWATPAATGGVTTLSGWTKTRKGLTQPFQFRTTVGEPDPGAGQVYYPLRWKNGAESVQGHLHLSNVENVLDPTYRMTRVNEFRLSDVTHPCRYQPQAAFMGATDRETIILWENGETTTLATRPHNGRPGVYVRNGKRTVKDGTVFYTFTGTDSGGYEFTYQLSLFESDRVHNAFLDFFVGTLVGGKWNFLAYSISLPAKEQP